MWSISLNITTTSGALKVTFERSRTKWKRQSWREQTLNPWILVCGHPIVPANFSRNVALIGSVCGKDSDSPCRADNADLLNVWLSHHHNRSSSCTNGVHQKDGFQKHLAGIFAFLAYSWQRVEVPFPNHLDLLSAGVCRNDLFLRQWRMLRVNGRFLYYKILHFKPGLEYNPNQVKKYGSRGFFRVYIHLSTLFFPQVLYSIFLPFGCVIIAFMNIPTKLISTHASDRLRTVFYCILLSHHFSFCQFWPCMCILPLFEENSLNSGSPYVMLTRDLISCSFFVWLPDWSFSAPWLRIGYARWIGTHNLWNWMP